MPGFTRKPPRLGLVASGNLTDSILVHVRDLPRHLGPVKASSLRVASRFANQLRAGYAVDDFSAFETCPTVLVCVPERNFASICEQLAGSATDWSNKIILAMGGWHDAIDMRLLRPHCAAAAFVASVPGLEARRYLVEGNPPALREARRLLARGSTRLIEIRPGARQFVTAAIAYAGPMLIPVLAQATLAFRTAKIDAADADLLTRTAIDYTLRAYFKSRRAPQPTARQVYESLRAIGAEQDAILEPFQRLLECLHEA